MDKWTPEAVDHIIQSITQCVGIVAALWFSIQAAILAAKNKAHGQQISTQVQKLTDQVYQSALSTPTTDPVQPGALLGDIISRVIPHPAPAGTTVTVPAPAQIAIDTQGQAPQDVTIPETTPPRTATADDTKVSDT